MITLHNALNVLIAVIKSVDVTQEKSYATFPKMYGTALVSWWKDTAMSVNKKLCKCGGCQKLRREETTNELQCPAHIRRITFMRIVWRHPTK